MGSVACNGVRFEVILVGDYEDQCYVGGCSIKSWPHDGCQCSSHLQQCCFHDVSRRLSVFINRSRKCGVQGEQKSCVVGINENLKKQKGSE